MKDFLLLITAGAALSLGAWAFWRYLGRDASSVLTTIMLVVVVVDNVRLRRRLRDSPPLQKS